MEKTDSSQFRHREAKLFVMEARLNLKPSCTIDLRSHVYESGWRQLLAK